MADNDIEAISHLVALKEGWSELRRLATATAYEAYLARSGSGVFERPTLDVDALWHCHILNTTSYERYCKQRFGRYVHHLACVAPEFVDALRARLGGTLPDFMPVVEEGDNKADCGDAGPQTISANCGAPADCAPDYRLADCGSKKKTKKKKKKKKTSKRKLAVSLADCGPRQPRPMPNPSPPGIALADCGTSKKGPRPVPPRPGIAFADYGASEQSSNGPDLRLADCGDAQRELPRPTPLPPTPNIAASA
jgi:hypothetical protein